MTDAELSQYEALGGSLAPTPGEVLDLVAEVRRLREALATFVQPTWRDGRYVAIAIQDQWAAAVAAAEKALS